MIKEKENDQSVIQENKLIIVSDLENVINLLRVEVGSFFYKRMLNLHNSTTITSDKQGHGAISTWLPSRRAGNNIASAFNAIFKMIVADNSNKTDFICWSDSSIPQNRKLHISQAILEFLQRIPSMKSITLKNSIADHSCVQEVDNMYKEIEEAMQLAGFYSPVLLL